jgi:hypothetical protein
MQSTNDGRRYIKMRQIVSTAARRERIRATLKAAMTGGTGLHILVLLLLASVGYVVFGGAYEAMSAPKAETSVAAVAAKPADAGGASRNQKASSGPATPSDYFPAGYVNRGRHGDGNVMTYEHD